ncbi:MAG TPA: flagellar hook-basal body complex protein [Acetobacteraceae bacterium]|nr:flagellar hook-basal body complex protein [Acetobacteraceae bacterium]
MDTATYVATSRLVAQQRAMDVLGDNIANAGTPGFKAERVLFSDWLARQQGTEAPRGGRTIAYTQDRATYRELEPGSVSHTGNPLDVAITGDGYFTVGAPQGPRLTRAGRFGLMPDGTIADGAGNALLDTNGKPLQIAQADTRITIAGDGTVSSENGQIGKIGIVKPADPRRLQAEGGRLARADTPTSPVATPKIVQGAVEESNVQPITEMTRMMTGLREFQFVSQFVQGESDRQQSAIDKILTRRT